MTRKKQIGSAMAQEVRGWFLRSVMYEGEPYTIDLEQAEAVADESKNAIVVARAGSGKTRTIVAKMTYLIAKCGVRPEELMAFVFNANAAAEINARLSKMLVDGIPITEKATVASTFHAFARKIVYDVCDGREKCKQILADDKEGYMLEIVKGMVRGAKWRKKITEFLRGEVANGEVEKASGRVGVGEGTTSGADEKELERFAKMMALFVNRAQQKYLGGDVTLGKEARRYLKGEEIEQRERLFIELGVECHRRYHWYLLSDKSTTGRCGRGDYGTDFNLIVSWAAKLIAAGKGGVRELLSEKKYILIDEYQDFSQLFLSVVLAIRKVVPEVKIFVVGDDLQAINRFAGSDVEYFKEFEKFFPEGARRMEISTNYRCDYRIVDTARKFMVKAMGEKGEFRAFSKRAGKVVVVNPRLSEVAKVLERKRPVRPRAAIYEEMARKVAGRTPRQSTVQYLKTVVEIIAKNKKAKEILILHRNNETNIEGARLARIEMGLRWGLARLGVMGVQESKEKLRLMTMHKSKGLEGEVVIILEADVGVIPKTHPDTRLYGIFGETEEVALEDQKRLFYVAITRAKKRLYIIHDGPLTGEEAGFVKFLGGGTEKW